MAFSRLNTPLSYILERLLLLATPRLNIYFGVWIFILVCEITKSVRNSPLNKNISSVRELPLNIR